MLGYLSSLWFGIALMGSFAHGSMAVLSKKEAAKQDRIPAAMRPEVFRPKLLDTEALDRGAGRAPGFSKIVESNLTPADFRDPSTQTWGRGGVMYQSGF